LGRDRVHVVLFEDFIQNRQQAIDQVTHFIGAPQFQVPEQQDWFNKTYYPVNLTGQRLLNQIGKHIARQRYRTHASDTITTTDRWINKIYQNWFHKVNPLLLRSTQKPPMNPQTHAYLTAHLQDRNCGLSELLDRDLASVWPGFVT
jgi:hypothetical protein